MTASAAVAGVRLQTGHEVKVTAPETTARIDFRLKRGAQISGRVTNAATGAPVAGVNVKLLSRRRQEHCRLQRRTRKAGTCICRSIARADLCLHRRLRRSRHAGPGLPWQANRESTGGSAKRHAGNGRRGLDHRRHRLRAAPGRLNLGNRDGGRDRRTGAPRASDRRLPPIEGRRRDGWSGAVHSSSACGPGATASRRDRCGKA